MKKQINRFRKSILFVLIALIILTGCGKEGNGEDSTASVSYNDVTEDEYDALKYGVSDKMSPDEDKVKLEVPDYLCEEEVEYKVTPLNQYVTKGGESKAYRYDISSEQIKGELNGFMEIHLPYDDSFFETGEDPAKCLSVHYVNEEGKLELELFDVDTENKEVIIYAQHLSPREIYHYKTQKLAEKYDINFGNLIVGNVNLEESEKVFIAFSDDVQDDPQSWDGDYYDWSDVKGRGYMLAAQLAAKPYFPVLIKVFPKNDNNLIYDTATWVSNAANILSLGGPDVQSYINRGLTRLSTLGMYTSLCKLSYELETDYVNKKTREEVLNLYKTLMNTFMDYLSFNYSAWMVEKVAMYMSSVFVFNLLIDSMFAEASYQKMWEMGEIYEYFNDSFTEGQYKPRSNMEWYNLFMEIIEKYIKAGKQDYIEDAIDHEIYTYSIRFWSLDQETADSVADAAGYKRRLWPTEAEQKKLTDAYIENLKYRLHPIVAACQKTMQKKTELLVLNKMQETYNNFNYKTVLKVKDGNQKVIYGGYWFRFKGLTDDADPKIWKGQLDKNGQFSAKFSICDWIVAGQPIDVALYKNEKDMSEEKNAVTTARIVFGQKSSDESTVSFLETEDLVWALDTLVYVTHGDNFDEVKEYNENHETCSGCVAVAYDEVEYDYECGNDSCILTVSSNIGSEPEIEKKTINFPPTVFADPKLLDEWAIKESEKNTVQLKIYTSEDKQLGETPTIIYQSGKKRTKTFEDLWPAADKGKAVFLPLSYYGNGGLALVYRAMDPKEAQTLTRKHVEMKPEDYFNKGDWR